MVSPPMLIRGNMRIVGALNEMPSAGAGVAVQVPTQCPHICPSLSCESQWTRCRQVRQGLGKVGVPLVKRTIRSAAAPRHRKSKPISWTSRYALRSLTSRAGNLEWVTADREVIFSAACRRRPGDLRTAPRVFGNVFGSAYMGRPDVNGKLFFFPFNSFGWRAHRFFRPGPNVLTSAGA